jgi:hypothetical protein
MDKFMHDNFFMIYPPDHQEILLCLSSTLQLIDRP